MLVTYLPSTSSYVVLYISEVSVYSSGRVSLKASAVSIESETDGWVARESGCRPVWASQAPQGELANRVEFHLGEPPTANSRCA